MPVFQDKKLAAFSNLFWSGYLKLHYHMEKNIIARSEHLIKELMEANKWITTEQKSGMYNMNV